MQPTLFAVFPNADLAWRALRTLVDGGAGETEVSLISPEVKARKPIMPDGSMVATLIPGFGTIIGRGPLARTLADAVPSTEPEELNTCLTGELCKRGVPKDLATEYRQQLESGNALLAVELNSGDTAMVRRALARFGAMDVGLYPLNQEMNYTSEQPVPLAESPFAAPEQIGLDALVPSEPPEQTAPGSAAYTMPEAVASQAVEPMMEEHLKPAEEQPRTIKHLVHEVEEVVEGGRIVNRREITREEQRPAGDQG
ncbi:MAG: hypothetical protein ACYCW6_29670 [Candidatus Xenobia bacterium]